MKFKICLIVLGLFAMGAASAQSSTESSTFTCNYTTDIDQDDDGLIEICDIEGLNAIRYQKDGTGYRKTSTSPKITTGCPADGCKGYELTGNLDLSEEDNWLPINSFTGIFEGNGYTISNLKINRPNTYYIGLFSDITRGSEIKNIGLLNVTIKGSQYVGGLVGQNNGSIANSYATGSVDGDGAFVGGLVGYISGGSITNSYATGSVDGDGVFVGGLVGQMHDGSITNSYAAGPVDGRRFVGGLVGHISGGGSITNSYATGSVVGDYDVGGLVGGSETSNITNSHATGSVDARRHVGGLFGHNYGSITNSYATGPVNGEDSSVGGLAGTNSGSITNSYATGSVAGTVDGSYYVGGLVGLNMNSGSITDSYATGSVVGYEDIGGLVGLNGGSIANSYATSPADGSGDVGGLVGQHNRGTIANSYWDTEISGISTSAAGTGKTTAELQSPTTATGIYSSWSTDNWDFGTASQYPALKDGNGNLLPTALLSGDIDKDDDLLPTALLSGDIDKDDDGLIEIDSLEGLNAIRYQKDGTGYRKTSTSPKITTGCPADGCKGYELTGNLDLSEEDNWLPINSFTGIFEGNGYTISNLKINRPNTYYIGLFSDITRGSEIKNIGLLNVDIKGDNYVGGLVGKNDGNITDSYVAGSVEGDWYVGGLIGKNNEGNIANSYATGSVFGKDYTGGLVGLSTKGSITDSYATGSVDAVWYVGGLVGLNRKSSIANSYATGSVVGQMWYAGGLVGKNVGNITDSYATGSVVGDEYVGGLVGKHFGRITGSYATGSVVGDEYVGGLVGWNDDSITNSYATDSVDGDNQVGGLVGWNDGSITNSYATGSVDGDNQVGGLVGRNDEGSITNSYATGSVDGQWYVSGLVGRNDGGITDSYWDTVASGISTSNGGIGKTTAELQSPTTATGIYSNWSADNWAFGTALQYPILKDENGDLLSPPLHYGLSRLRLTEGYLTPDFITSTLNYAGTVVNNINTIYMIPTAANPDARIRIESGEINDDITSGSMSSKIILNPIGITTITITVINSEVTTKYDLHINYYRFNGDVDKDNDGLIEIDNVEGLNAIRYQADGTGYRKQAQDPKVTIGCPAEGCKGYELTANLDLSGRGNWLPINFFQGIFEGNGHTISNLKINRSDTNRVGLFSYIGRHAEINNIGLLNVDIKGNNDVGSLVGRNGGSITNSYATGSVDGRYWVGGLTGRNYWGSIANSHATGSVDGSYYMGGLVGQNGGTIANSYATGSVDGGNDVGGLVGENGHTGSITNSYATGSVDGSYYVGGLVGDNNSNITDSYATGSVDGRYSGGLVGWNGYYGSVANSYATGSVRGNENVGGLVGRNDGSIANSYATGFVRGNDNVGGLVGWDDNGSITDSYWDTVASRRATSDSGIGKTTAELQSPIAATGIYRNWSTDNWYFGTASQYPVLIGENGNLLPTALRRSLRQLRLTEGYLSPDFIDSALNYTGTVVNGTNTIRLIPTAANPDARIRIDSGEVHDDIASGATSSEITLNPVGITTITIVVINSALTIKYNLSIHYYRFNGDVDKDDDGLIEIDSLEGLNAIRYQPDGTGYRTSSDTPKITIGCPADGCKGYELTTDLELTGANSWLPINAFTGIFEGNGHTISNLKIYRPDTDNVGLFGDIRTGSEINNISLSHVVIKGNNRVGSLVGQNSGSITNSYATAHVNHVAIKGNNQVGSLVGQNSGSITNSYATAHVNGDEHVGGLVGLNYRGTIAGSYATGSANGDRNVGGLVGRNYRSTIAGSYATGSANGSRDVGGLVGRNYRGTIANSYWDTVASGRATSDGGTGKTTTELQSPTTATGIYSSWSTDNWDFGTSGQLPILKYHDACTTTIGQPICGAFLPNQGTGLRTLEASASHVVPLLPVFSSEQSEYIADIPPDTDSINLRLISYDADATFEIRKQGENTNYFTDNEKSTIAVTDGEILTIQVTGAVADTAATTTTTYTLQMSAPPITLSEISVTKDGKDTGNTVSEGDDITLRTTVVGSSGGYQYKWEQTSGEPLATTGITTDTLSIKIPDGFVKSAATTSSEVTFTVTVTDSKNNAITESKILTIAKIDNSEPIIKALVDGMTLTAVVTDADDYDGNPNNNKATYQWQKREGGSWMSIDEASTAIYKIPSTTNLGVSHRVIVEYTDDQGYEKEVEKIYPGATTHFTCSYAIDIDQDDDGLIEICDIEGLNAIRYQADGTGYRTSADTAKITIGCPADGCKGYELTADLNLIEENNWLPINSLTSIFEGNGHTISNLKINRPDADNVGLFGLLIRGSEINNIGLLNIDIKGNNYVGGLVGRNNSGSIKNGYASGSIAGKWHVGGLVGQNNSGSITNSYTAGSVDGEWWVGGLVGENEGSITNSYTVGSVDGNDYVGGLVGQNSGSITNSYTAGSVSGYRYVGGLVGWNRYEYVITNSYATGPVSGYRYVGGLVGKSRGRIANSYATGFVEGDEDVGGLVGQGNSGSVANSYWDTDTSGRTTSADGTAKTTTELQSPTTTTGIYSEWSADNWDFGTASQYPVLKDENGNLLSPALRYGLSRLRLAEGHLSPDFIALLPNYIGTVVNSTSTIQLIPTAANPDALIRINSGEIDDDITSGSTSSEIILNTVGITTIAIVVINSEVTIKYNLNINYYRFNGDIDKDDDGLIEIDDLEGLNAIHYQPDGTGYRKTGTSPKITIGCPANGCMGYELTANLDLSAVDNWLPIESFAGIFEGNGHTISNLKINRPNTDRIGLFGYLEWGSEINNISLLNVDIKGNIFVGGLVGRNNGSITNSYATGFVKGEQYVGGLAGYNSDSITNSYATGSVNGDDSVGGLAGYNSYGITNSYATSSVNGDQYVGGLIGRNYGDITNSYATSSVNGDDSVGGLIGWNSYSSSVTNSYANGSVDGRTHVGGLVGWNNYGSITNSYWDKEVSEKSTSSGGIGKTTTELQSPIAATGIYRNWSTDNWDFGTASQYPILKDENGDLLPTTLRYGLSRLRLTEGYLYPDFITSLPNYTGTVVNDTNTIRLTPTTVNPDARIRIDSGEVHDDIASGSASSEITLNPVGITTITIVVINNGNKMMTYNLNINYYHFSGDIDKDDDGLIEVDDLEGLNAIRYRPDGTGYRISTDTAKITIGCPADGCKGYELTADLDLTGVDNWSPINALTGIFEGNGHTISNLKINRPNTNYVGLFGYVGGGSKIKNISLLNVDINGNQYVGGLVGQNDYGSSVANSYASGSVDGDGNVGGLVGMNYSGRIANSYSTGPVNGNRIVGGLVGENYRGRIANSYATGPVDGRQYVGGLVGWNYRGRIANSYATGSVDGQQWYVGGLVGSNDRGSIIANSYATGSVDGRQYVGGLVGDNGYEASITDSYATGSVDGSEYVGGLAGHNKNIIRNSYWDTEVSGKSTSDGGIGKTTAELQSPIAATGIYSNWDTNNWDFGTSVQLPILKYHDACTTTIGQPICGAFLPNQGTGLRTLEVSASHVVPLLPVFSSEQSEYMADTPPGTDSINLRLISYDAGATFEIRKQGEDTNYFTDNEKSTVPVTDGEILTIQVTGAVADTAATTTTTYTLRMSTPPITLSEISVTKDGKDTGNAVSEGDDITLRATGGSSGGYQYKWEQTSGQPLATTGATTDTLSIKIPDDFVKSATTTSSKVTFTVTVTDSENNAITESKMLTIIKIDNSEPIIEALVDGRTLTAVVSDADDYDGNPNNNKATYQWQKRDGGSWINIDETSTATYKIPSATEPGVSHRVIVEYTDDQGYEKEVEKVYPVECDYALDIDQDNDGLIEICSLEGLNAIRYQADGTGYRKASRSPKITTGCPADGCKGYELMRNLDFLDDASYRSISNKDKWTKGEGWQPIRDGARLFSSTFEGNNHTISNLMINRPAANAVGLFHALESSSEINNLGLLNVDIKGNNDVGSLAGWNFAGRIANSYATGSVDGEEAVGGLVGSNAGRITNSYATGSVDGEGAVGGLVGWNWNNDKDLQPGSIINSYATGSVVGKTHAGGLVGRNNGRIANSYAIGSVNGQWNVGGLVGRNSYSGRIANSYATGPVDGSGNVGGLVGLNHFGRIANSYATGPVDGDSIVGGLVGDNSGRIANSYAIGSVNGQWNVGGLVGDNYPYGGRITNSYWDTVASGRATSDGGAGKTIAALQSPTTATGIYSNWDTNNWDFGTSGQLPILKYHDACTTTTGQPICGAFLPNQGTGLRTLEVSASHVVPLLPVFSSEQSKYIADIPPGTDSINLRLISYDAGATFEIRKQGDDTNYFTDNEKSTIAVTDGEILTIQVAGAVADTTATTITSYTLQIGSPPITLSEISVTKDGKDTGNTVSEGDDISLRATVVGSSGGYQYNWEQTSGQPLATTGITTDTLSIKIPNDFVKSAATTSAEVVIFTVTATDTENDNISVSTVNIALTIVKQNNGDLVAGLEEEHGMNGTTLTAVVRTGDPDGYDPNTIDYQWQKQVEGSGIWIDTGSAAKTYAVPQTIVGVDYRVKIKYTDNQGYRATAMSESYRYEAPEWEVSLTKVAEDNTADTDSTVNEGSEITLNVIGGSGDYQYEWTQTPENSFSIPPTSSDELSFDIPYNFIKSATTTNSNVTFTVRITDSENHAITETKTLTVMKIDNSEPVIEALVGGTTLTAVVSDADDYDDNPNNNKATYQWLKRDGGSWVNIDEAGTAIYKIPSATHLGVSHRVIVEYTDDQGYEKKAEKIYPGATTYFECDYATDISRDIDQDDDGLIEICSLEGLNAMRYQPDGTGYRTSTDTTKITIGCPANGCKGYELAANLDLSEEDNWLPIKYFAGIFEGNGYTISNLKINRPNTSGVGLFDYLENISEINNISLLNVDVKGDRAVGSLAGRNSGTIANSHATGSVSGNSQIGGLAGWNDGSIINSYATGSIDGNTEIGGIVGHNKNIIRNSYATGPVVGDEDAGGLVGHNRGRIANSYAIGPVYGDEDVGGLTGENNKGRIANSYATGSVDGNDFVGGLTGWNSDGRIANSYAAGPVYGQWNVGGLAGWNYRGNVANSYWDTEASGMSTSAVGIGKTTAELQSPTAATGIYSEWSTDDWDFGSASQYPVLKDENGDLLSPAIRYGLSRLELTEGNLSPDFVALQPNYTGTAVNNTNTIQLIPTAVNPAARIRIDSGNIHDDIASGAASSKITLDANDITTITIVVINNEATIKYNLDINYYHSSEDIDKDDDGLIEIDSLEGLNAIRYQTDGTGYRTSSDMPKITLGCPADGCKGYELTADLDLSEEGNWLPINFFTGIFEGNGHTISNLKINRPDTNGVGLFGYIGRSAETNNISLLNVDIKGAKHVGSLAGWNSGSITDSYATGSVVGQWHVGGLIGYNRSSITNSYASGSVVGQHWYVGGLIGWNVGNITNSYATGSVNGDKRVGGLAGWNSGNITDSHATSSVVGQWHVGGLVGLYYSGSITNSYATGSVVGHQWYVGGLVGRNSDGRIANSYATGSVNGEWYVGGLVGGNFDGKIANSYATGSVNGENYSVGGLVGWNNGGRITNSYATGHVDGDKNIGGLVGKNGNSHYGGSIANSYATGPIDGQQNVGGLVGENISGRITNSYATGSIDGQRNVGGLVGQNSSGRITNSYATGHVDGNKDIGGLVGNNYYGSVADSYWDTEVSGILISAGGTGKTTAELQSPTAATGIYAEWSTDNWYFGTASQYPVLKDENGDLLTTALLIRDIDKDDDGLIEIGDLEDLNAIRYQPDGTGYRTSADAAKITIGCPENGCKGYELTGNLDLSAVDNWLPINAFTGIFEGNGHTISNLNINRPDADNVGLFGYVERSSEINNISLLNVDIRGNLAVGGLVGRNNGGSITNSYASGSVNGDSYWVGGLIGQNNYGSITNSYATGSVKGNRVAGGLVGQNYYGSITNSYASGSVNGDSYYVGGLIGQNNYGSITNSYATGSVNGQWNVGGLVGVNYSGGSIANSYATGPVDGQWNVGGLVGWNSGSIANSYWDTDASGTSKTTVDLQWPTTVTWIYRNWSTDNWDFGTPKTTAELQSPTTATGIYSSWSTDDWDFGTSGQLPILKYHDACTTTIRQPICGAFLPNQGTGLRTLEASASHVVPLLPVFSSEQSKYMADTPPGTDSINLRLISYDAEATFEIRKQGDDTNYFTDNEKNTIAVTDGEILTIQVTGAVADTTATTITSYTLQIGSPPITLPEISVTEDGKDTGNTVSEGDDITLRVIGSSGDYQYEWMQTPENSFSIPPGSNNELSFDIPYTFIKSATTTNSNVTFTVTITDSENNAITETKILTIAKIDNSEPVIEALVDGRTLTAVVSDADDYDDNPNNNETSYQWQKQDGSSWVNIDEASAAIYKIPSTTNLGVSHRVIVEYTDDQGYEKEVEKIYPGATTHFVCDYALDIDQDDDGLIEICDIEGFNAIRYQADGTGYKTSANTDKITIGCPADGCKGYELTGNLDLSEEDNWLPINAFTGIFEGNGHTISNLKINRPDAYDVGLFDYLESGSEINNISLLNVDVKGNHSVGSLAGRNVGTIANSHATGSVSGNSQIGGLVGWNDGSIGNSYVTGSVGGDDHVGGLVGWNSGSITNSHATGSIEGDDYVGGLTGRNYTGSITNSHATGSVVGQQRHVGGLAGLNYKSSIANSYATGSVVGQQWYVGGLVGVNYSDGSIVNSYAASSVDGKEDVGGLVGLNYKSSIANSYAIGSIDGQRHVGGLVGRNGGRITNSYWDTEVSGILTSAGGTSKTTVELQSPTTATGIYSNWDTNNWDFGTSGQLPILKYTKACTTTADQPICGAFLPNQGTGLRTLEASTSHVVRLLPVFSSEQSEYMTDTPPGTDSINLRLISYDAGATFEIKKQGENTNYFTDNEKSTIAVTDGEILTIRVAEAVADTTATTIISYTLQIGFPPIMLPEISVTEYGKDTGNTVGKGSDIPLRAIDYGGSSSYQYEPLGSEYEALESEYEALGSEYEDLKSEEEAEKASPGVIRIRAKVFLETYLQ